MDYEKKYKEALERAREAIKNNPDFVRVTPQLMEEIFPELAESEDERIRKEILEFVTIVADSKSNKMEWIAWLEKQAPKPKWSEEDDGMVACIKSHLRQSLTSEAYTSYRRWLDSLKQRMGGEE